MSTPLSSIENLLFPKGVRSASSLTGSHIHPRQHHPTDADMRSEGGHAHAQVIKPARTQFARVGGLSMFIVCLSLGQNCFMPLPSLAQAERASVRL